MLKELAILAVLLTVTQASVPTTGQTANNGTQSSDSNKQAAKDNQDKSSPITASETPSPSNTKATSADNSKENKEVTVTVVKLPTVAVDSNRLD
jgi:hypothetical protein